MKKYILLIGVLFLLYGCDSNPVMRQRFGDEPQWMYDQSGNEYIVEHNLGDNYTIRPVPKRNK